MSKFGVKKTKVTKRDISQPLNFRQTASAKDDPNFQTNRPAENVYVRHQPLHSPQGSLPAPCPGTSNVQNIGTLSLNQNEINSIVSQVTEAIKQELQSIIDDIQQLKDHKSDNQYRCSSCQNMYERENNQNSDKESSVYVNYNDMDPHVVNKSSPTSKSEGDVTKTVFNPTYNTLDQTLAPPPCQLKMGRKPVPQPRTRWQPCFEFRQQRGRKFPANQRDCYAKAIQTHIHDIVDGILFTGTHLPDDLITEDCLTETECKTIREKSDLKDQLRNLVVIIKTRDLRVIMKFLDCLEKQSPKLVQRIRKTFDAYNKEGFRERKCLMCRLKCNINIKNVADQLYAKDFIGDEIYNEIICCERPTGVQDIVWEKLLENLTQNGCSRQAFETIEHFLQGKGHYTYLADYINKALSKTGEMFECACKIHVRFSAALSSAASSTSNPSASSNSSYGPSSEEVLSGEHNYTDAKERDEQQEQQDETEEQQEDKEEEVKTITEPRSQEEIGKRRAIRIVNACFNQSPPPLPKKKRASTDSSDSHSTFV